MGLMEFFDYQSLVPFVGIVATVVFAIPLFVMGQKANFRHAWFAFVPVLNLILMLDLAGKELWWLFLICIPVMNIVIYVLVWMGIAESMGKPDWFGVLMLIPGVNCILPYYIAFG